MSDTNGTATVGVEKFKADLSELGRSGLATSGGLVTTELLRELHGTQATRMYAEMTNDDIAGAMLFAVEQLAKQIAWTWAPASLDAQDMERAEFLRSCWDDMSISWGDTLSDILTMLPYGWALVETVFKVRGGETDDPTRRSKFSDGKIGIRKLAGRAQETLARWEFDAEGGVQSFVQSAAPAFANVTIPISKALLFRTTAARSNPEGRSIFRSAFIPWRYKTRIREIEAIGIERDLAGYPVFELQPDAPDIWNTKDPTASALLGKLERIIRNVRRDEQEGMILPPWVKLVLLSTGSRRNFDTGAVIARYDQRIAMTILADFILIGHESVGSFAMSEAKTELFASAMTGFMDQIAETVNRHLVPRLMRLNGWPVDRLPRLVHGDVERVDLTALGTFVTALAGAGMPMFPSADGALERALLDAAKLPVGDATTVAKGRRGEQDTLAAVTRKMAKGRTR